MSSSLEGYLARLASALLTPLLSFLPRLLGFLPPFLRNFDSFVSFMSAFACSASAASESEAGSSGFSGLMLPPEKFSEERGRERRGSNVGSESAKK